MPYIPLTLFCPLHATSYVAVLVIPDATRRAFTWVLVSSYHHVETSTRAYLKFGRREREASWATCEGQTVEITCTEYEERIGHKISDPVGPTLLRIMY